MLSESMQSVCQADCDLEADAIRGHSCRDSHGVLYSTRGQRWIKVRGGVLARLKCHFDFALSSDGLYRSKVIFHQLLFTVLRIEPHTGFRDRFTPNMHGNVDPPPPSVHESLGKGALAYRLRAPPRRAASLHRLRRVRELVRH